MTQRSTMLACLLVALLAPARVLRAGPGDLDMNFGQDGVALTQVGTGGTMANAVAVQPDGKIVVAGAACPSGPCARNFALVRYDRDGTPDPSFGSEGTGMVLTPIGASAQANALIIQPDGK